ncbi:MAG TPA: glucoamylase family protein [Verrucomicrobiae bacterium]|nr:glucoamylase family protein [Verrucomicrobiae bacterium]
MKNSLSKISVLLAISSFFLIPSALHAQTDLDAMAGALAPQTKVIHDFEGEDMVNQVGGASGSWNLDASDINNAWCDEDVVEMPGKNGQKTQVLRLNYSVESELPAQNGFWTKLQNFDAKDFDHLEFEIKGDAEKGFTNRMKIELKKCKKAPCTGTPADEVIKGSALVPVSAEWTTVSIPLNKITGIMDFSNPKVWENPSIARENLDELVFVFQDRHVTAKKGTVYIDNIRFVKTGNPGPTAVDFPPRRIEKTPTKIEGLDFAKFLIARLGGFPKKSVVKKEWPQDQKEFLKEIAKDTWRFFDEIVDKEHGLPLDTVQIAKGEDAFGDGTWIGDYTNVTNIGVYLMCVVSGYDLGFITKEEAVKRLKQTMTTLEKLDYHQSGFPYNYYDTTTLERTSYFVSLVDSGWLLAGLYVVKNAFPEDLSGQAERLLNRGNLVFFYDPVERQFFHGYYDHLEVYSDYHYGTFYTEPRATSYMGIARGEVPEEHWFNGLIRTFPESYSWQEMKPINRVKKTTLGHTYDGGYYQWKDLKYVPSWGGSAFEALMPTLILKEKDLAPEGLGGNDATQVQGQIRYALDELKQPVWGMSPSSVPEGGYSEYGAKPFGSKGYKPGVVTPHASILSLEFAPEEVVKNLRKLLELYDIYGEYGFYDAVTPATGLVARKYLSLDQGMILVALNNYLNNGAIRNRFHADPTMKNGEKLLTSEKFFEGAPEAAAADAAPAAAPQAAEAKAAP